MGITDQTKTKMTAAIEHFKNELKNIRTNRANPSMLDSIFVDVYGSSMRIKDIASITAPEARLLLISPFDPHNSAAIGKAIERANLGVQPIVEGNSVRIKIAAMDEGVRKEMVKLCHKRQEEAKVSIRNIRREFNDLARKQKSNNEIGEDILKKIEKDIQELTDKFCKEVEVLGQKKEQEVMTV